MRERGGQVRDKRGEVTRYLAEIGASDKSALDRLFPLVYEDLRAMARKAFRDQRAGNTLQPTVLVHEVYARLVGDRVGFEGRRHFFRVAAMAMRQLLTDHARARGREKRGGGYDRVLLNDDIAWVDRRDIDLLALDEALEELQGVDERLARTVELRFLVGLSARETAGVLGVTDRTVRLDWAIARKLLRERLSGEAERAD